MTKQEPKIFGPKTKPKRVVLCYFGLLFGQLFFKIAAKFWVTKIGGPKFGNLGNITMQFTI